MILANRFFKAGAICIHSVVALQNVIGVALKQGGY